MTLSESLPTDVPAPNPAQPVTALIGMLSARAHDRALVNRMARILAHPTSLLATMDAVPDLIAYTTPKNEEGLATVAGLWGIWHLPNRPTNQPGLTVGEALAAVGKKRQSFTATHTAMQRLLRTPARFRRQALVPALRLIADAEVPVDWRRLAFACISDDWGAVTKEWARAYFRTAPVDAR